MAREIKSKEIYAIKFLELEKKENEIAAIANEINILKETVECPYVVEYVNRFLSLFVDIKDVTRKPNISW